MVRFQALGGLTVTDGDREVSIGGPRQRRLLAVLLVHRNAVVSVDRLTDVVFAGEPTPAATTTLRSYVARIRKVVSTGSSEAAVIAQAPGYTLRLPVEAFDVTRFEQGLSAGRSILYRGEAREAAATIRESLSLWRGDAYEEFAEEDWVQPEAQRLGELRLVAQELLFDAELACGRSAEVTPDLESMVCLHPLRERFVGQLMTALYRTGRQADALRAYQRHRELLIEEMGLDPTPALQALEGRILDHDPGLVDSGTGQDSLRGYVLGDRLGTGEEGTVHAAHLPGVERDLVIRVVRPEIANSACFVRSFEADAHRIASLHHPAIVPIHDYWREPGAAYVVMRRMHGGSLADRLERRDRCPLSVADITSIVRRVGSALVAVREAGLVHGRVDPRSVLFDEVGEAWLSDFDLGASIDRSPDTDVAGLATVVRACLTDPPGPVTVAIERGMSRANSPSIDQYIPLLVAALTGVPTDGQTPITNPYKGLRAFDESDTADFFGRTGVVDELVRRLSQPDLCGRLVLVVGGSGTGKSSVVRAGLLPRLRRGDVAGSEAWFLTTMLPGATPFKELAAALRRVAVADDDAVDVVDRLASPGGIDATVRRLLPPGGQLLLVVDQFEELFTSAPEATQRRFLDSLMDAVTRQDSRVRIVGTLRADFYDRPLALQPFGSAVNDATVTIPAMLPAELEAAIVEPAERAGRHVDQALVVELVSATAAEPAGLPALQFTLYELAERSSGDLTIDGYRDLGGLNGAIASRAEALYRSLDDDDERAAVRRLFQQLVVVSADGEATRRRATRTELSGQDPAVDAVIDRWAEARLLSLDRHRQSRLPTVEPAHEALLREWPRLRRWIEDDREALLVLGRLREAATSWVDLDRDPGALYRGARLQVALDTSGTASLTPLEREFLDASAAGRDAEEREAEGRVERTARANRRLRRQLVVIGVALVIALVGGFVAIDQREDARSERRAAFVRELAAAADATLGEDPERAVLLALEAVAASDPADSSARPEAIGALHDALSKSRLLLTVPGVGGSLDWSSDGSLFITEGPDDTGLVDLRDAETGESVRSWIGHDVDVNQVAFAPDGSRFATGGDDGYLRVWDTSSGDLVAEFDRVGAESASAMSFSPDGRLVVGHWIDHGRVEVFDIRSGEVVVAIELPEPRSAAFSPDGATLALVSPEGSGILIVDPRTGEELQRFGTETGSVKDARFSPDGRWLASAHEDGSVRIWSAVDFELRSVVTGHTSEVTSVAWSPDSTRLATAGNDGTARVHDLIPGGTEEAVVISGRDTANGIPAVKFSPDGRRIMTSDWTNASVQVWDVTETAGGEWATIEGGYSTAGSGSGSFLPDGRRILGVDPAGHVGVWRPDSGAQVANFDIGAGPDEWIGLAASPDGSMLAAITDWGVRLWDLERGERVADVGAFAGSNLRDMAWAADSDHLAIAHDNHTGMVTVVDRTGTTVAEIAGQGSWAYVSSVAFVGDSDEVAMVTVPVRLTRDHLGIQAWDWRKNEITLEVGTLAEEIAADPTSNRVVATELLSGAAHIYDMETGERVQTLRGAGTVRSVAHSPDGERVALGAADGTVRVFDAETGRLDLVLRGHERAVVVASFSPDGTKLSSADEDGIVRVWALDVEELVTIARSRVTRSLDDAECRQYLRLERCTAA